MRDFFTISSNYGWTEHSPEEFSQKIKAAGAQILELRKKLMFDAIAFSGSSGAAIAFHLSIEHNIPIIYIRKQDEKSHGLRVEANTQRLPIKKYLIVDDFICSGSTIKHIYSTIKSAAERANRGDGAVVPKLVGVFCYACHSSNEDIINIDRKKIKVFKLQ